MNLKPGIPRHNKDEHSLCGHGRSACTIYPATYITGDDKGYLLQVIRCRKEHDCSTKKPTLLMLPEVP